MNVDALGFGQLKQMIPDVLVKALRLRELWGQGSELKGIPVESPQAVNNDD